MKKQLFTCIVSFIFPIVVFGQLFPGKHWDEFGSPEEAGWSSEKLAIAKKFYDSVGSAAVIVIHNGKILVNWGETDKKYYLHSMRKSLLNMLYGYQVDHKKINLNKTLKDLNIDDITTLTEKERTATILNLLMARSGVYLPAAAEAPGMRNLRPERGSKNPGEYWYYNNWDFNVLGTIYEQMMGRSLYVDFNEIFAKPLGMEHYSVADSLYQLEGNYSKHRAYHFIMSAKDIARLGYLMINKGKWNNKQILSSSWVEKSTSTLSTPPDSVYINLGDYGYLWWVSRDARFKKYGMYSALGFGGHVLDVLPGLDLIFVHRVDTFVPGNNVKFSLKQRLLEMIINARN